MNTPEKRTVGRRAYHIPPHGDLHMSAGECWITENAWRNSRPPRGKVYREGLQRRGWRRWVPNAQGVFEWVVPVTPTPEVQP